MHRKVPPLSLPEFAVDIAMEPPVEYVELMWDIFFESRNRGQCLATHFPWFGDKRSYFVTVRKHDRMVAGLAVNPVHCRNNRYTAGLVGLVCVHPSHRNQGLATLALTSAIRQAKVDELDDLILWASLPAVYEKLGFESHDTAYFGWAKSTSPKSQFEVSPPPTPRSDCDDRRGTPPFASKSILYSSSTASIIVLEDTIGPILAEWSGPDQEVVKLIDRSLPDQWRLNALEMDTLPDRLESHRWSLSMQPCSLQMILPIRRRNIDRDPYKLRVLDRI